MSNTQICTELTLWTLPGVAMATFLSGGHIVETFSSALTNSASNADCSCLASSSHWKSIRCRTRLATSSEEGYKGGEYMWRTQGEYWESACEKCQHWQSILAFPTVYKYSMASFAMQGCGHLRIYWQLWHFPQPCQGFWCVVITSRILILSCWCHTFLVWRSVPHG